MFNQCLLDVGNNGISLLIEWYECIFTVDTSSFDQECLFITIDHVFGDCTRFQEFFLEMERQNFEFEIREGLYFLTSSLYFDSQVGQSSAKRKLYLIWGRFLQFSKLILLVTFKIG